MIKSIISKSNHATLIQTDLRLARQRLKNTAHLSVETPLDKSPIYFEFNVMLRQAINNLEQKCENKNSSHFYQFFSIFYTIFDHTL